MSAANRLINAPAITAEEEQAERERLSEEERLRIRHDVFGDIEASNSEQADPSFNETSEIIEQGLASMRAAIEEIPIEGKRDFVMVQKIAPDIVAQESPLLSFLRCENYDVWAAAHRIVNYWKLRCETFGEIAFHPMRLTESLSDCTDLLEKGVSMLLPPDRSGRQVLLVNRACFSRDVTSRETVYRLYLYFANLILTLDPMCGRHGAVIIFNVQRLDFRKHFDRRLSKMLMALSNVLPFEKKARHWITGPGKSVMDLIFPALKFVMGKHDRLRTFLHSGSREEVVQAVKEFGLDESHISHVFDSQRSRESNMRDWVDGMKRSEDDQHR